jgi:hypothetical protein
VPSLLIAAASVAALGGTFTASTSPPAAASTTQTRSANHQAVLPKLPAGSGDGRRIVFDQSEQRVWLVAANDDVKRSYLVTGSNRGNLRPGFYAVKSRTRYARTYRGGGTLEYFVKFAQGRTAAIGFHAVTEKQGRLVYARSDLGTPHTPGCVEAWLSDAKALWAFAPIGTKVVVRA